MSSELMKIVEEMRVSANAMRDLGQTALAMAMDEYADRSEAVANEAPYATCIGTPGFAACYPNIANAAQEPVAWMHESPSRCDVIHEKVRALLQSNHERHNLCGQVERPPVNTVEHYTIPLFSAPPSSAVLVKAMEDLLESASGTAMRVLEAQNNARKVLAQYQSKGARSKQSEGG